MNENINLCEILKGHEGKTFYSPTLGNLLLKEVFNTPNDEGLDFESLEGYIIFIYKDGKESEYADEIVVFPSKDQRDWYKWFEEQNHKNSKI